MVAEWDQWYYLIYLLPLGLAFVLMIASALMGGGDGDGDADAPGFDADAGDVHADFDGAADAPAMAGDFGDALDVAGAEFDADADVSGPDGDADGSPGGAHGSFGQHALSFFGIGRAPLTLLLQGFMLAWGAVGFYATQAFQGLWGDPTRFVPAGMAAAALSGLVGMKTIGAFGSRYMKSVETYAVGRDDLVGEVGTVTYPVSETSGRVHVYDRHGSLHIESCRVRPGADPIPRNEKVLLVKHDTERHYYWVERSPV